MGKIVEIAKILVSPAEKLIDVIQAAIGKAYEPRYEKRMSDAKAYEITTVANALRESCDIPITYNKDGLTMSTADEEFVKRTQNRLAYQELTKQKNIESVVDHAYEQLKDEADVPNNPVDPDWINRFFNAVAEVSSEDMQRIWGKILAGEVKRPGSFSLRTLQVIKNINKKEALLFEKIAPFVISCHADDDKTIFDSFLFDVKLMNKKYRINFPDIMLLEDADLFYNSNTFRKVGFKLVPKEKESFFGYNRKIEITNISNKTIEVSCLAHVLTEAGKELLPIILDRCTPPEPEYFSNCMDVIVKDTTMFSQIDLIKESKIGIVNYNAEQ